MSGKSKIHEYKTGEALVDFFLLKKVECKLTSAGSKYLDIVLSDASGDIVARFWDCSSEDEMQYNCNMLVKVQGCIVEWQGKKQIKIEKIRPVTEEDGLDIGEYIPAAPFDPEEMYTELLGYTQKISDDKLRGLAQYIINEAGERLLTHPAAVANHHSFRSGLLYHTLTMLKAGEKLLEIYTFLDKDLLFTGIILHDIAKLDEIAANELGLASEYTFEGQLLGHLVQGIKRINQAARQVGLSQEKSVLLEHMLLSHHYEPEFGSPKRPMIPEAELLHYLDILDARMFDMHKALGEIQPGEFTDRLWILHNRRLYKPNN